MNYRKASNEDLPRIKRILEVNKLPSQDCGEHIENFIILEEDSNIVGFGGLEICGRFGLVRSIVVIPEYRRKGLAKKIYKAIEDKARSIGIKTLYLLTESEVEYFEKLGFTIKERSEVPASVMETKQFSTLCPSSAIVMYREINKKPKGPDPIEISG